MKYILGFCLFFNFFFNFLFTFIFFLPKFIFIFFFTEITFLISIIYLICYENFNVNSNYLNQFYAQLILGVAAAEAALFLGLFSHFYREQLTFRISQQNFYTSSPLAIYY